jgi:hypothetical protein
MPRRPTRADADGSAMTDEGREANSSSQISDFGHPCWGRTWSVCVCNYLTAAGRKGRQEVSPGFQCLTGLIIQRDC